MAGIVTKGRADAAQRVTNYRVEYSLDGLSWMSLSANFVGNTDQNTVKQNLFSEPIMARYIKIIPTAFYSQNTMRADLIIVTNPIIYT